MPEIVIHWAPVWRPNEHGFRAYCGETSDYDGHALRHDISTYQREFATCPACIAIAKTHGCMSQRYFEMGLAERNGNGAALPFGRVEAGNYVLGRRVERSEPEEDDDELCNCDDCVEDREREE